MFLPVQLPFCPILRSDLLDLEPIAITLIVCEVVRLRQESLCRAFMKDASVIYTVDPRFTDAEADG